MEVKFVAEEKYRPQYANETDACMDLKVRIPIENPLPNNVKLTHDDISIVINPKEVVKLRTGVQVAIPEGYVMKVYVRSSTGIKKNLCLANGTGIIDAGYRDEIITALYNFGNEPVTIKDGDRLCQFIILPFPKIQAKFVEDDEEFRKGDRGGGIGSTDKQ